MTQLKRLVAICILTICSFGIALADGGNTQGPPLAPPAPPACNVDCSGIEASTTTQPPQDSSVDIVTEAMTRLATWLEAAIF